MLKVYFQSVNKTQYIVSVMPSTVISWLIALLIISLISDSFSLCWQKLCWIPINANKETTIPVWSLDLNKSQYTLWAYQPVWLDTMTACIGFSSSRPLISMHLGCLIDFMLEQAEDGAERLSHHLNFHDWWEEF